VFVTGATGLVGSALVPLLLRDGHEVIAWVRSKRRARHRLGQEVELCSTSSGDEGLRSAIDGADAVIHLAGENVMGKRWNGSRKQALIDSRVQTMGRLVEAIRAAESPPSALISASAIGYYPSSDEETDESAGPGSGFLADLCVQWERAAEQAESDATRVARIRIGIVLGYEDSALQKMAGPIRAGIGGAIGSGKQPVSWIHIDDLVEILLFALDHPEARGALNATAPNPVTNGELTKEIGKRLRRWTPFKVPGFALRVAFGEGASVLLEGTRVVPRRLEELGFAFRFATIDKALDDLLGGQDDPTIRRAKDPPPDLDGSRGKPIYRLSQELTVDVPIEQAFAFFSEAANLGLITPSWTGFQMTQRSAEQIHEGATLEYRIRLGPVPFGWKTLIARWQPTSRFVDTQERGPYRLWWHEHRFEPDGDRTRVLDRVYYTVPLGWIGRLVHRLFVSAALRRIFRYRKRILALRFGLAPPQEPAAA
jgi:uncharacterized protein (TIGR01777 family)